MLDGVGCIAAAPLRNHSLVIEALSHVDDMLSFKMLVVDTDNDSVFMNQTIFDHCKARGLEQTRSRDYKKNDHASVEPSSRRTVRSYAAVVGCGLVSGLAESWPRKTEQPDQGGHCP